VGGKESGSNPGPPTGAITKRVKVRYTMIIGPLGSVARHSCLDIREKWGGVRNKKDRNLVPVNSRAKDSNNTTTPQHGQGEKPLKKRNQERYRLPTWDEGKTVCPKNPPNTPGGRMFLRQQIEARRTLQNATTGARNQPGWRLIPPRSPKGPTVSSAEGKGWQDGGRGTRTCPLLEGAGPAFKKTTVTHWVKTNRSSLSPSAGRRRE